jgi:hypothetical protein
VADADVTTSNDFRAAVTRAQWAVIQTGLITSGLALFGVYVLATRINDLHLMSMYAPSWLPTGPLLVGLICGSGYILSSWWFGVRVGSRMVATIVALQLGMFLACHYADFETLDLIYRDTGQSVDFITYFNYQTSRLSMDWARPGTDAATRPSTPRGYAIRMVEATCFTIGGILAAFTLAGRPRCAHCGGLLRRRCLAAVDSSPAVRHKLDHYVRMKDLAGFDDEIARNEPRGGDNATTVELWIARCEVCGNGLLEERPPGSVDPRDSTAPASAPTDASPPPWQVAVSPDFARQLFDRDTRQAGPRGFAVQ